MVLGVPSNSSSLVLGIPAQVLDVLGVQVLLALDLLVLPLLVTSGKDGRSVGLGRVGSLRTVPEVLDEPLRDLSVLEDGDLLSPCKSESVRVKDVSKGLSRVERSVWKTRTSAPWATRGNKSTSRASTIR